jgi:hypothetical protein
MENIEQQEAKNLKKFMIDKRKLYGELVKELFVPKPQPRSNFLEKSNPKKDISIKTETQIETTPHISPFRPTKKKIKKTIECKTPDVKSQTKFDYLYEMRVKRASPEENSSLDDALSNFQSLKSQNKSNALKKIRNYEKIASTEEQRLKLYSHDNYHSLETETKINDLLIQSVKAKLDMLEPRLL